MALPLWNSKTTQTTLSCLHPNGGASWGFVGVDSLKPSTMQGMTEQQPPMASTVGTLTAIPSDTIVQQSTTPTARDLDPKQERSRERTPVRRSSSPTPSREVQAALPAIEDGTPPRRETQREPREHSRERRRRRRSPSTSRDRSSERRHRSPTPDRERSHRDRKRSPISKRDHASEERQRSPSPPRESSHRRRASEKSRHPSSSMRDRPQDEQHCSPSSTREHRHHRRRRSPTPAHDRLSEERKIFSSPIEGTFQGKKTKKAFPAIK